MDTKLEPHRRKRKAEADGDDFIDKQGNVAVPGIAIPKPHKPSVAAIADNGGSVHSNDEIGAIHDDEHINVGMGVNLEAGDNTLSQADRRGPNILQRRTRLRTTRPRSRANRLPRRGAETFMNLCNAIARFLAAFLEQEQNLYKTPPPGAQGKKSNRDRSPSGCNTTTSSGSLDGQLTPDHLGTQGIICPTSSDSAPVLVDQGSSRDKEWEAHKARIRNMLRRFLRWKRKCTKGDLRSYLRSRDSKQTVKHMLLSIGEKLSDCEYNVPKVGLSKRELITG
ncbi:hypothetical protein O1611_g6142 [Lasiodiplodia mahajangana]|uniref:Uncharacterized protein n=1 Tax=Lasiodiplodia mahajangana TaxID=1108764 RepID=A0ACC2JJW2_9PEZI|nr:hypothetical protein O1611_g6142 [Lasiodiplodia mahajangana]